MKIIKRLGNIMVLYLKNGFNKYIKYKKKRKCVCSIYMSSQIEMNQFLHYLH
jgi:hypothetical protein